ncbi:LuxR C-terminal-related transcriptional regulator [Psychrobacter sp. WY6]|uniref:helix-turn-helix transcriptional regulator n=1 Tax=Psychrobacter sp. WY6 TaxID=2708350 RepID=UPI002022E925|nr:LuxR C-terminal-related transcriptional regulator [Psychrobacter sp. WY6]
MGLEQQGKGIMNLTKTDYQNILSFINSSLYDYRNIQSLLSKLFKFDRSLLWHADEEGNMHSLKFYNFSDQMMFDYKEIHRTNDVMHPKKHLRNLGSSKDSVYRIGEVTTQKELANSSYNHFIERHEIIDQMVMYLSTATTIYAGIGFVRFKGERLFTRKDKKILQTLSTHLQHLVKNSMRIKENATVKMLVNPTRDLQPILSTRELEVYRLVTKGCSNIEIADQLYITIRAC